MFQTEEQIIGCFPASLQLSHTYMAFQYLLEKWEATQIKPTDAEAKTEKKQAKPAPSKTRNTKKGPFSYA